MDGNLHEHKFHFGRVSVTPWSSAGVRKKNKSNASTRREVRCNGGLVSWLHPGCARCRDHVMAQSLRQSGPGNASARSNSSLATDLSMVGWMVAHVNQRFFNDFNIFQHSCTTASTWHFLGHQGHVVRSAAARSGEFAPWQWVCSSPFEFIPATGAWSRKSTQDTLKTHVIDSWCFWLNSWASIVISSNCLYGLECWISLGCCCWFYAFQICIIHTVGVHNAHAGRQQRWTTFLTWCRPCWLRKRELLYYWPTNSSGLIVCALLFVSFHAVARLAQTIRQAARLQYVFCKGYIHGCNETSNAGWIFTMLRFWAFVASYECTIYLTETCSRGSANCLGETRWHGVKLTQQEAARWSPLHPWEMWGWVNNDG